MLEEKIEVQDNNKIQINKPLKLSYTVENNRIDNNKIITTQKNETIKFKSQVCTTKDQSQRLLDLGLKPETADMYIFDDEVYIGKPNVDDIPAWSLHRLLCMLDYDNADTFDIMPNLAYEDVIATISLRVGCGAFNKEYLKQCQTKGNTESI